jgi:hypothetical protein
MKTMLVIVALAGSCSAALATPILYGNVPGSTVVFTNVSEDSATDTGALFGTPSASGDVLTFNPTSFNSFSSNGSSDITDGTLQFGIRANPGFTIPFVNIQERGDYIIVGSGGFAQVGLAGNVRIEAVNGVALSVPLVLPFSGTFTPGSTFTSPAVLSNWSGGVSLDLNAFLAANAVVGSATRVQVSLDNVLVSAAGPNGLVNIAKKQAEGVVITIPTPGAAALVGLGTLVAAGRRRR